MYRDSAQDRPMHDALPWLPAPLAELVVRPPLVSTWVPSVTMQALFLAIADHYAMSDEHFMQWTHRTQKTLLSGRLYRSMMALASPALLLTGTSVRWRSFHRGSEIEVDQVGAGTARLSVVFPRGLYATTNLMGFAGGFQAVAELSNATTATVVLTDVLPTRGVFTVRWS